MNRLLGLAIAILLVHSGSALADDDQPPVPVAPVPAPAPGQVYTPLYTAPLSQQTQTTYVPQSVALSGPEEITDVGDNQQPPAGYTAVQRRRKGLLIGGLATLGASYSICLLLWAEGQDQASSANDASGLGYTGGSAGPTTNQAGALWVPIAGPFIQMAQSNSATEDVLMAGFGIAQIAGAVMAYYGMTTTKRVFVRNDLVVMPMVSNGAPGFALAGRF